MSSMEWLEYSALGEWVGTSTYGYPFMLASHSIGLAIVVGILFMINLRVVGFFPQLEIAPLRGFLKLAWAGFVVNLVSGIALFVSQASYFVTHTAFIIKIVAIFLAIFNAAFLQGMLKSHAEGWDSGEAIPMNAKILVITSLILWSVAIIAGRLIAYV